ncbi:MAG TPA: hypothetical protein VG759_23125 [Candidatus Angelobacter sp.]|jgi:hypothetical protein|nr:hypothetical protein [Candidatus Angelobacter sp.]
MYTMLDGIAKATQILAILVAGAWVYFKTIRGRTFIPRLQPKVSAKVIRHRDAQYLLVDIQVQNVGASMARITDKGTSLEINAMNRYAMGAILKLNPNPPGIHLRLFGLGKEKSSMVIEPGAIIFSEEIVEVPVDQYDAFQVAVHVTAPEGFFRRKYRIWSAWAIALLEPYNEVKDYKQGAER